MVEGLLLESLALGKHVLELAVGHWLAGKLDEAISSMRAVHNRDLERAIAIAFENATRTQEKHARTKDEKLIWQQLHGNANTLFAIDSDGFPFAVIHALVIGNENTLREALATVIAPYVRDISPELRDGFQRHLSREFHFEFGEVLKQGEHERAWNAFLREILRKTYQKLEEQTAQVTTLAEEQRQMFTKILQRLDGLARGSLQLPNLLLLGITDGLLRFDKMISAELIRAGTTTFDDEYVARLLWGNPRGRTEGEKDKAWFKLMAEVAATKNDACKAALEEIEDLFPVHWQRKDEDRYPFGIYYDHHPLGIRSVTLQGKLIVSNFGEATDYFTPASATYGNLELGSTQSNVKLSINYRVIVDGDPRRLVTVQAGRVEQVPLQIDMSVQSEETVWDTLEAGQTLAERLKTALDGLQLKVERENARTIFVPFGIRVQEHEQLPNFKPLDIAALRKRWDVIRECCNSLRGQGTEGIRDKWEKYGGSW